MMEDVIIRDAQLADTDRLLEIYAYYVEKTAVSFEYDVSARSVFQDRMRATMEKYPYLVAEKDGFIWGVWRGQRREPNSFSNVSAKR